jgi:hypothetical protein
MPGGYDIGASFSAAGSSGTSHSGAIDAAGGGNYGGVSYGAGSLLINQPGASQQPPLLKIGYIIAAIVAAVFIIPLLLRRKK